jgi:hypothetical protein
VTSAFSNRLNSTRPVTADFGDALVNTNEEVGAPDLVEACCP